VTKHNAASHTGSATFDNCGKRGGGPLRPTPLELW
jgi:hypothetical protein